MIVTVANLGEGGSSVALIIDLQLWSIVGRNIADEIVLCNHIRALR